MNTCSVREKAQEKVFSLLGEWRALKERRPGVMIGVGGCVASQEGEAIAERAPCVDLVFGPQTLHRLPQMLAARRASGAPQVDISFPEVEKFDRLPEPRASGTTAFLSIMEGCSKYCSFCVVPYTRGAEVSRSLEDVLREARALVARGVREITLLGQNVNAYRGALPDGEQADFALLLELLSEVSGLTRIRYTSSHPREFTQRLVDARVRGDDAVADRLDHHVGVALEHGDEPLQVGQERRLAFGTHRAEQDVWIRERRHRFHGRRVVGVESEIAELVLDRLGPDLVRRHVRARELDDALAHPRHRALCTVHGLAQRERVAHLVGGQRP